MVRTTQSGLTRVSSKIGLARWHKAFINGAEFFFFGGQEHTNKKMVNPNCKIANDCNAPIGESQQNGYCQMECGIAERSNPGTRSCEQYSSRCVLDDAVSFSPKYISKSSKNNFSPNFEPLSGAGVHQRLDMLVKTAHESDAIEVCLAHDDCIGIVREEVGEQQSTNFYAIKKALRYEDWHKELHTAAGYQPQSRADYHKNLSPCDSTPLNTQWDNNTCAIEVPNKWYKSRHTYGVAEELDNSRPREVGLSLGASYSLKRESTAYSDRLADAKAACDSDHKCQGIVYDGVGGYYAVRDLDRNPTQWETNNNNDNEAQAQTTESSSLWGNGERPSPSRPSRGRSSPRPPSPYRHRRNFDRYFDRERNFDRYLDRPLEQK